MPWSVFLKVPEAVPRPGGREGGREGGRGVRMMKVVMEEMRKGGREHVPVNPCGMPCRSPSAQ